jgi:hypothetical protein
VNTEGALVIVGGTKSGRDKVVQATLQPFASTRQARTRWPSRRTTGQDLVGNPSYGLLGKCVCASISSSIAGEACQVDR